MTDTAQGADVRVELIVAAPPDTAFAVFTEGFDTWWPRDHHIGKGQLERAVIEPRVGGRCYGLEADGTVCPWGTVLAWDPPRHLAFSWDISLDWQYQADPAARSRVDVAFAQAESGRTVVTLVHSQLDRHGDGWTSMRDAVASDGGWPDLANTYGKAVAAAYREQRT